MISLTEDKNIFVLISDDRSIYLSKNFSYIMQDNTKGKQPLGKTELCNQLGRCGPRVAYTLEARLLLSNVLVKHFAKGILMVAMDKIRQRREISTWDAFF
jgi:hypothetical protein